MARYHPLHLPDDPKLAQNIMHFARALRRAGLPIGTGRVIDAIEAVSAAGFTKKQDFNAEHFLQTSKKIASFLQPF